jgi:hypothetical protein
MAKDRIQHDFVIGEIVNIPFEVTAISGGTQPTVSGTTKYPAFDGNRDTVTTLDAIQVIKDN